MPVKRADVQAPISPISIARPYQPPNHWGVDLAGVVGTEVLAPEDGTVYLAAPRNDLPGFEGFGPAFCYLQGATGMWHLLAELAAVDRTAGRRYVGNEAWDNIILALGDVYQVHKGERIGVAGDRGYVHWEVGSVTRLITIGSSSDTYIALHAGLVDPMAWLASMTATVDDDATTFEVHPNPQSSSGVSPWLLVLGGILAHEMGWL